MSENNNWEQTEEIRSEATEKDTDKKCPNCGGGMNYNPATKGLKCPFCDYEEEIEVTKGTKMNGAKREAVMEQDLDKALNVESFDWGTKTKTVACKSCGAHLVYDALQNSEICPYCGSNQVMQIEDEDTMRPGGVVPFQITDKKASEAFGKWIKGRLFCPSEAKRVAKAEKFKGIYLPYWTFDTDTESRYTGQYGKQRTVGTGDNKRTEIKWYNTSGNYDTFINDFPILATQKHDSAMLNKLLPYDTEDNKAYEPQFVAGFASERYSIGLKDGWNMAKNGIVNRLEGEVKDVISKQHNTSHVRNVHLNTTFYDVKYKYLLLPVWNSYFKYNGKIYNFMVNGQTGKVAGKTPISPLRVAVAIILGMIAFILLYYFVLD